MGLAKPPPPPKKLTKAEVLEKKMDEEEKKEEDEKKKEIKKEGVNPHKSDEDDVPYDPKLDFSNSEKVKLVQPLYFEARDESSDYIEHWPINPYPFVLAQKEKVHHGHKGHKKHHRSHKTHKKSHQRHKHSLM